MEKKGGYVDMNVEKIESELKKLKGKTENEIANKLLQIEQENNMPIKTILRLIDADIELIKAGMDRKAVSKYAKRKQKARTNAVMFSSLTKEDKDNIKNTFAKSPIAKQMQKQSKIEKLEGVDIKNNKDFVNYFLTFNFLKYFGLNVDLNTSIQCCFISGNTAWVSRDGRSMKYRYFSKNEKTGVITVFGFFDIASIVFCLDTKSARRKVARDFGITYKELEFEREQIEKYTNNFEVIHSLENEYPAISKYVNQAINTLIFISSVGQAKINGMRNIFESNNVFFSSTSYIANISEKSQSKISLDINILATLGFITKLKAKEVPKAMFDEAENFREMNKSYKMVNFYTIPLYDKVLLNTILERVEKLLKKNIKAKEITETKVIAVFKNRYADRVYPKDLAKAEANGTEDNCSNGYDDIVDNYTDDDMEIIMEYAMGDN